MRLGVRGAGYCSSFTSLSWRWPTAAMSSGFFSASCSHARSGSLGLLEAACLLVEGAVRAARFCVLLAGALVWPCTAPAGVVRKTTAIAAKSHKYCRALSHDGCLYSSGRISELLRMKLWRIFPLFRFT